MCDIIRCARDLKSRIERSKKLFKQNRVWAHKIKPSDAEDKQNEIPFKPHGSLIL